MKKIFVCFSLLIAFLSGCQEAAQNKDIIMFTGTESSPVVKFAVEQPRSMGITVSATDKVKKDTKVTLEVAKNMLSVYNAKSGRKYELPPDATYQLDNKETVIKSGQTVSEAVSVTLKSFDGFVEGTTYCIPIRIVSSDGDMPILEASRTIYIVLNRTMVSRAVNLRGQTAFNVPLFQTDKRVSNLEALTMEIRVLVNRFPSESSNPGISSLMGIEEKLLLRFGDVSIEKKQLQVGPAVINDGKNKYHVTGNTRYQTGIWYHVACVYDGSSISVYVNGVLDVKFGAGPGGINLNDNYWDGFWFGQSCGGRRLDGAICEARFWNRALSAQELQDNVCFVNPKSPGLLAYWRFNSVQQDGKTVHDETGNGFDAISSSSYIQWLDNVKCPF